MAHTKEYDLNLMTGEEIFWLYFNSDDEYGNVLGTAYEIMGEKLFPLVKKAQQEGKKVDLKITPGYEHVCDPPLYVVVR